jgi:hypothetical protein
MLFTPTIARLDQDLELHAGLQGREVRSGGLLGRICDQSTVP